MSEAKFTPGPWRADETLECVWIPGPDKGFRIIVADTDYYSHSPYGPKHRPPEQERLANTRLIAAAPELYEVADEAPILSQYHGAGGFELERFIADYEAWSGKRRAALSKAEGRE